MSEADPRTAGVIAIGIFLLAAIPAAAQIQPQNVTRDRRPPETTGTASISGRVVDGISGAALARVRVMLEGGGARPAAVTTDTSGRFTFSDLPAAGYWVTAQKSTYLPARYPQSGQTLRAQSQRLTLEPGQALAGVTLRLFRGGAITGRVFDANGDPVEYVEVRAMRVSAAGTRPVMRGGTSTNDIGEFRVARLEPGNYMLMAMGRRVGGFDDMTSNVAAPPQVPVPTYYPGVISIDQAQAIAVGRGQTVSEVDITLIEGTAAVVSGAVVGEDGEPVSGNGMVMARTTLRDGSFPMDGGATTIRPDGTFRFALAPGDYTFEARVNNRSGANARAMGSLGGAPGAPLERSGSARVSVTGNVENLIIVVGTGATATGKVLFEGTSPIPPVPPTGQFRIPLNAPDGNCRQGQATIGANWTFRVEGLAGTCTAVPMMGFGPWVLKSVTVGDQELLHDTVTFENGQRLNDVIIVMTDRRGAVAFEVMNERGEPTSEYVGLVFPVAEVASQVPSVRTFVPQPPRAGAEGGAPAAAAGAGSLSGLPAGDYYVVAVDDVGYDDLRDPAVVKRLTAWATRVTLGDTPTTRVPLRRVVLAEALKRDR